MNTFRLFDFIPVGRQGNVSVFTALMMFVIACFVALAFDTGLLVFYKNDFQEKTDAAVLSGVQQLTDPTLLAPLQSIYGSYMENGEVISLASLNTCYQPGFYDYYDRYTDFPHYKDFALLKHDELPDGESVNAVAVIDLEKDVHPTLMIKPASGDTARVAASTVAYYRRYLFLAFGADGIDISSGWDDDFNVYREGIIGSNGDVRFQGTEVFDATVWVEAVGDVTNNGGQVPVLQAEAVRVSPIDWGGLREKAAAAGVVYSPGNWPEGYANAVTDDYGNCFCRYSDTIYFFLPAPGDHLGRIYYFDVSDEENVLSFFNPSDYWNQDFAPNDRTYWNFTMAAPCVMSTYPVPAAGPYDACSIVGDVPNQGDDGIVYFYCKGMPSYGRHWYTSYNGKPLTEPQGVILQCEGKFEMYTQQSVGTFRMRVVAESIHMYAPSWRKSSIIFDGAFGPPVVHVPRLGRLVNTAP
jgi:hypothetical protein